MPLRALCATVRWCSASSSSPGQPTTVNDLHQRPEMLARFDPSLIRNFRCALQSTSVHDMVVVFRGRIVKISAIKVVPAETSTVLAFEHSATR